MQFTIEARELSRGARTAVPPVPSNWSVDADDPREALERFTTVSAAELMSLIRTSSDGESIATVRKDDTVFLVRVYRE